MKNILFVCIIFSISIFGKEIFMHHPTLKVNDLNFQKNCSTESYLEDKSVIVMRVVTTSKLIKFNNHTSFILFFKGGTSNNYKSKSIDFRVIIGSKVIDWWGAILSYDSVGGMSLGIRSIDKDMENALLHAKDIEIQFNHNKELHSILINSSSKLFQKNLKSCDRIMSLITQDFK